MELPGLLAAHMEKFGWLFEEENAEHNGLRIDLNRINPDIERFDLSSMEQLESYIQENLLKKKKKFAYGGYGEDRYFYARSPLFIAGKPRTIHLGVDFWLPANTPVYLPFDGIVSHVKDNAGKGNYGPTIITEHRLKDKTFYMLFGHLSRKSLDRIQSGIRKKQGDLIGWLGSRGENGDWPPHLHFQLIENLLDDSGDYPGVSARDDSSYHLKNCPDPGLIFNLE